MEKQQTKSSKIIYWTTTTVLFLFEGVMPALTGHTELAKEGVRHLGYPSYFGSMLVVLKVLGALALLLPMVPARIKEWAYAGFAITMLSACVSHWVVDGFGGQTILPIVIFAILVVSYVYYHKLYQSTVRISHL